MFSEHLGMNKNRMADKPGQRPLHTDSADEQQMEQIREILFGEQQRQTDAQLSRLEGRIGEQVEQLRGLLESRLAEAHEALRGEIDTHARHQQTALDGLDDALRATLDKTVERITLLDSDLQDTGQRLSRALEEQHAAHDALAQRSVSREDLAALLEQIARQLRSKETS